MHLLQVVPRSGTWFLCIRYIAMKAWRLHGRDKKVVWTWRKGIFSSKSWFNPGSNRRPSVCKTEIITTRPLNLIVLPQICQINARPGRPGHWRNKKNPIHTYNARRKLVNYEHRGSSHTKVRETRIREVQKPRVSTASRRTYFLQSTANRLCNRLCRSDRILRAPPRHG